MECALLLTLLFTNSKKIFCPTTTIFRFDMHKKRMNSLNPNKLLRVLDFQKCF